MLEVYTVDSEEPVQQIKFDTQQSSFDFLTKDALCVCDNKGRLTLFTNVLSEEKISMKIIETDQTRFRSLQTFNLNDNKSTGGIFVTVSPKSVQVWSTGQVL